MTGETIERKLRHLGAVRKLLDEGVAETGAKPEHGCACWFCRLLREREAMDAEDAREQQAGG